MAEREDGARTGGRMANRASKASANKILHGLALAPDPGGILAAAERLTRKGTAKFFHFTGKEHTS
jgi:hypothetical protein